MPDFFAFFRRASELAPHGYCLLWDPQLVWTHVIADALIAAAYFSIPIAIVRFVTGRKDVEFSWIFWLFALFIVACGTTHLMGIWVLWNADYAWQAVIKVITAIASVGTAIVLWPLIPKALAIPSPLQLRQANEELGRRVAERDDALARLRQEIAERERAEAALVQAQKMEAVGQLTGGIAHDFNNLLQAVTGMLALIERHPERGEKVRDWARHGLSAAERGTRLTGQLLAFSRVQKLDLKPILLTPLVENMLELLSRALGSSIRLETDLAVAEACVVADRTQLELALLNLAINARDAMPAGGTLTVRSRIADTAEPEAFPDGAIEMVVEDTGTGMAPDVAARAFEPFFTTKGVGKGTGLGLSMVYGVARQSGGSARIESVPGEGTRVIVTLRRVAAPQLVAEAPGAATVGEDMPRGAGETVLVVDDDADVRASLRGGLESIGYRVEEAPDGPSALKLLERIAPDLAILDYAMPGMTGAELALEATRLRPAMKIVFASGFADSEALERALGSTAPILKKPFAMSDLAHAAARTLGRAG
jgi:signal transduction histidine kinase